MGIIVLNSARDEATSVLKFSTFLYTLTLSVSTRAFSTRVTLIVKFYIERKSLKLPIFLTFSFFSFRFIETEYGYSPVIMSFTINVLSQVP